jgi:acyl-[acyl-carrier-protein]-phospholipid O-acyltransferase/long-chain-fatty-acid--[acyl-carrier-protein] ligase
MPAVSQKQFSLFQTRRFLPLFLTQFLGAFNDNIFKNAMVVLIAWKLASAAGMNAQIMITVAAGIFILPFFVFSATAGLLADKYDKTRLIRHIKLAEIVIMSLGAIGFYSGSVYMLMTVLFLMGIQSTFFGPIKYGILPDQLQDDELMGGNALVSAGTFLAILAGTILGTEAVLSDHGVTVISTVVIAVAALGWLASQFIPATRPAQPDLQVNFNFVTETWKILSHAAGQRDVFLCIMGISWFWLVGATFLAQLPIFTKDVLGATVQVLTLLLTTFSVGIAIGSLLCNRLLKGEVHATFVPLGALGISVFTIDLFFATSHPLASATGELMAVGTFLGTFAGWRVVIDLLLVAISGGIFIVPLYALVQQRSEDAHRARNIASNNVMNALFMVISALGTVFMLKMGFTIPQVFLTMAILNAAVAVYITKLLPGAMVKALIAWLLDICYRVEVIDLENYHKAGDRVLIVANHQSFLDAPLIAAYVPDKLTFAINTHIAEQRFIRFFLSLAETFSIDPTNPFSMRSLVAHVKENRRLVIFPEGRITVTGSLMKVYEGPGMIADKADATILPVRIEGAQYTPFSRLKGNVRTRWFPKITVRFMPPVKLHIPEEIKGRKRRHYAGNMLYDIMSNMVFESSNYHTTLFSSLLDARKIHGGKHIVFEDIQRQPVGYDKLVIGSFILGKKLIRDTEPGECVGVLLPNMVATAVTFFGLQAFHRVPAMLNFSTGPRNVVLACETARIKVVYTSRRFVETAKLTEMIDAIEKSGVKVAYLEDLRNSISIFDKLLGFARSRMAGIYYYFANKSRDPDAPCVVLFTSGTEGAPKGVVLSHTNLQANRFQVSSRIDFGPSDIVLNALPMFHSFGLTCGTLLPVLSGLRTFLYPSPLHYRIVPELAYDTNATIMFGTDTFLAGYARYAHPYDFYCMRYVFAGAEKVKDETRRVWSERFGLRVFEGYGATETAPALTMNTPMHNRPGAVGRLLPGIDHRLEPMPGIAEGGRLFVSGPNIMAGYLRHENPGVLEPPPDRWYDTGDIVTVDEDGFVHIQGRAKRFAKIGGEMISLAAVESFVVDLWPEFTHAVVNLPDPRKGERLVLVTDFQDARRDALMAYARANGIAELSIPRSIVVVTAMPVLGTGKMDYVGIMKLAEDAA